jgi:CRP-like cAMP-binding protein
MAQFLKFITDDEEAGLLAEARHRRHDDGDVIVREGERTHALFILRAGEARVERAHGDFSIEISRLKVGELFGEMGFVEDFVASASVVADGPCEVDVIEDALVLAKTTASPEFAGRFYHSIAELLSRRLRATSVQALSEFSWGTGGFARADAEPGTVQDPGGGWGGGSPLRDGEDGIG